MLDLSDEGKKFGKFGNLGLILAVFPVLGQGRQCVKTFKTAVQNKHFFDLTWFHNGESVEGNLKKKISEIARKMAKI